MNVLIARRRHLQNGVSKNLKEKKERVEKYTVLIGMHLQVRKISVRRNEIQRTFTQHNAILDDLTHRYEVVELDYDESTAEELLEEINKLEIQRQNALLDWNYDGFYNTDTYEEVCDKGLNPTNMSFEAWTESDQALKDYERYCFRHDTMLERLSEDKIKTERLTELKKVLDHLVPDGDVYEEETYLTETVQAMEELIEITTKLWTDIDGDKSYKYVMANYVEALRLVDRWPTTSGMVSSDCLRSLILKSMVGSCGKV